jgi:DNA topoisomerase-6 subunit B
MSEKINKTAEDLAGKMREVSVAEFFEKNKHLLGYENPTKALLTIVKEGVDNSLDACDEAGILPNIKISIKEIEARIMYDIVDSKGNEIGEFMFDKKPVLKIKDRFPKLKGTDKGKDSTSYTFEVGGKEYLIKETKNESGEKSYQLFIDGEKVRMIRSPLGKFRIVMEDNGPGVIASKVPLAFGKMLYGSKFHRLRQSRGTQGIGISGVIMYSQITTGKSTKIVSSTEKEVATVELRIDVGKNSAQIISQKIEKNKDGKTGLRIELETEGRYVEKGASVPEFLKQTAIANPHAKITYDGPNGKIVFERVSNQVPKQPQEILPHPYGVELGILTRMAMTTSSKTVASFLNNDFSKVGNKAIAEILKISKIDGSAKPSSLTHEDIERLHRAMQMVKLQTPETDVLSPMGEKLIEEGLKKEVKAEFFVAVSRPPAVYRGNPFQVEVGIAYGGELQPDGPAQIIRFANKVPLLYHSGDCATTESVVETDWKRYGFNQTGKNIPNGPIVFLVHFASVWVPYTSEGKQAIADYPEIVKEIKLALQEAGRRISVYVKKKGMVKEHQKTSLLYQRYLDEVIGALEQITSLDKVEDKMLRRNLQIMAWSKTQEAYNFIATNHLHMKNSEEASVIENNGYKLLVSEKGTAVGIAINSTHKGTEVEDEAMKILDTQKGKYKHGYVYYCDMSGNSPTVQEHKVW